MLRNKELTLRSPPKTTLGQLRGPSDFADTPRNCPTKGSFSRVALSMSRILIEMVGISCDPAHVLD
jgi:hypothetical protein